MSLLKRFYEAAVVRRASANREASAEGGDTIADTYPGVNSGGKVSPSVSVHVPSVRARSASLSAFYPPMVGESRLASFERDSSYSCMSGASSDYVPRADNVAATGGAVTASSGGAPATSAAATATISSDAPDAVVTAVRYTYDPSTQTWGDEKVRLRILHPNRGINQDSAYVYFACDLMLLRGGGADPGEPSEAADVSVAKTIPMVARLFRRSIEDVVDADYLGEGQSQAVAESLAYQFNRYPTAPGAARLPLPLLTNRRICRISRGSLPLEYREQRKGFFSYITTDSRDIVMMLEPDVRECKAVGVSFSMKAVPSAAAGGESTAALEDDVYPPFDARKYDREDLKQVAEAFSHFSYKESKGQRMVHGLLYSHGYLLDPLVYTQDGVGYGMGNGGHRAIRDWVDTHTCNAMCRALGLDSANSLTTDDAAGPVVVDDGGKATETCVPKKGGKMPKRAGREKEIVRGKASRDDKRTSKSVK